MNFRQTLLIVFINLSLISLIFAATIASTLKSTVIAKSTTDSSNVGETKEVITTACDCVAFYLCDSDDVVTLPASSGEACAAENSANVCCKTTTKASVVTESTINPSNVVEAKKVISMACECVPFYLCDPNDVVSGEACAAENSANVCCKTTTKASVVTESTINPSNVVEAKKVISTACECVPFYLCNSNDVVSGEACAGKNSVNVCCKAVMKPSGGNK